MSPKESRERELLEKSRETLVAFMNAKTEFKRLEAWDVANELTYKITAHFSTPPQSEDDGRDEEREHIICYLHSVGHHDAARKLYAGMRRPLNQQRIDAAIAAEKGE